MKRSRLSAVATAAVVSCLVSLAPGPEAVTAPRAHAAAAVDTTLTPVGNPFARARYSTRFSVTATADHWSSAAVGDVTGDGRPDVVAAGLDGIVRVWNTNGALAASADMGDAAIYASPALGDIDGDGVKDVTVSNNNNDIASWSFRGDTARRVLFRHEPAAVVPGPTGMFASPALADLDADGRLDIVTASWGQTLHVISGRTGQHVPGWPKWLWDTIWSSPAVGDVDGDGLPDVVVGGDCDGSGVPQPCYGTSGGGYVWAFNGNGTEKWRAFVPGQVVWSSPALVDLNADGAQDVVVGTGIYWNEPAGRELLAFDGRTGRRLWSSPMPERVVGSPAVADVDGDGRPEIFIISRGARLFALRSDGSRIWSACVDSLAQCPAGSATHGGVALADVDGDGHLEAVTQGESWMRVYDARTGRVETRVGSAAPGTVFAPPAPPTVVQVDGQAWVVQTALGDANNNLRHDLGDELLVMVWRTGAPLGKDPWASFKGDERRTSSVPLPAIDPAQARKYVDALYRDLLGRPADPSGLESWSTAIVQRRMSRYQVATALARTDEWVGYVVSDFYRDTLGREPDAGGLAGWLGAIKGGMPVAQVASAFYASEEYYRGIGGGTNRSWVADLYRKLLLREPDRAGLDGWVRALDAGMPRAELAYGFYQSPETVNRRINDLYEHLLGRPAEPAGLASWGPLVRDHGDLVLAAALASSDEYWNRAQRR